MTKNMFNNCCISSIDKNMRKDLNNMSFVGLAICKNGIIGFGDSKSSRFDELGNLVEDIRKIPVQKVFKTNNYILAICGNNQLSINGVLINIEDWLNANLNEFTNPLDLLSECLTLLSNNPSVPTGYTFFIGCKDNRGYYTQCVEIINGQLIISFKQYNHTRFNNVHFYTMHASDWEYTNLPVEISSLKIKEKFEWLIETANKIGTYNPVGLPVQIEIFQ